jgi:hypothetical protein
MADSKPIKCSHCDTDDHIILANAGIFNDYSYWYCRKCKNELNKWGHSVLSEESPEANSTSVEIFPISKDGSEFDDDDDFQPFYF